MVRAAEDPDGHDAAEGVPAPVVPLKAGDTIEITIEGLGTPLRNQVIADGSKATR